MARRRWRARQNLTVSKTTRFFLNKGYMGMYNMSLDRLKQYKGLGVKDTLDRPNGENRTGMLTCFALRRLLRQNRKREIFVGSRDWNRLRTW